MLIKKGQSDVYIRLLLVLVGIIFPLPASAVDIIPFYTSNQNPLVQIHGIPPAESATVTHRGHFSTLLVVDMSSSFGVDRNIDEDITLDGEQYRNTFSVRYGIAPSMEIGIDIPVVAQTGGIFDGLIQGWHDIFGLSQGGRDQAPKNRLLYEYFKGGEKLIGVEKETVGIGDIRLTTAYQLYADTPDTTRAIALRSSVKVPTGSSRSLHGSGSAAVSLWLSGRERMPFTQSWTLLYAAGGMVMGKGDVLRDMQRELAGFGTFGIAWAPAEWAAVKAQINGNSAFYRHSALNELNATSWQFVAGGSFDLSKNVTFDVSISEDLLVVASSPDFGVTLALNAKF